MRLHRSEQRRGIILMVVLALLTLFAIVGVTFVLYADSEATSARIAREAETAQRADMAPEQALAFFLGQFIYDVPDDITGVGSALRGHSLARTMYGYNYTTVGTSANVNNVAFNGVGRLHYTNSVITTTDDYQMINYTWFSADNFLRDPERFGVRSNANLLANTQTNSYVGGNVPYTYPDLNNCFLAAVKADGTVLTPSFHRSGYGFGSLDPSNVNWYTASSQNPALKYLVLRPRPADNPPILDAAGNVIKPGFPTTGDAGGDVKNLPWAPGGNDSIWLDIGAPVMTAPDGTKYKMLVAPLIMDLDGRINLNTAGNILALLTNPTAPHVSNQGWGGWEVNLSKVLYGDQNLTSNPTVPPTEWINLFKGKTDGANSLYGKYAQTANPTPPPSTFYTPTTNGATAPSFYFAINLISTLQHFYSASDFNGLNEIAPTTPSSRPVPPVAAVAPAKPSCFPTYVAGYGNGGLVNGTSENVNHPLLFDVFRSSFLNNPYIRVYRPSDMEALLRPNNTFGSATNTNPPDNGSPTLLSDLIRLCPTNLGFSATSPRYRNLVTTLSTDLGVPGVSPYWWSLGGVPAMPYPYPTQPNAASPYPKLNINPPLTAATAPFSYSAMVPIAPASLNPQPSFPPVTPGQPLPVVTNNLSASPPNPPSNQSEFGPDWRALSAYWQTQNTTMLTSTYSTTNNLILITPTGRIRLNLPLPPYPHMGQGLLPPYNYTPLVTWGNSYYTPGQLPAQPPSNAQIALQLNAAVQARQTLANAIYRCLVAVTGVPLPLYSGNGAAPLPSQLAPLRWLAQLAVNIVDYIDEDDIITPFNFYTTIDGLPAASIGLTQGLDDNVNAGALPTGANPNYWVFGTELPKVVLNEVIAQAEDATPGRASPGETVKLWFELYNTMPTAATTLAPNSQGQDSYRVPLLMTYIGAAPAVGTSYSPYRVTVAQCPMTDLTSPPPGPGVLPDSTCNVLGKANPVAPFPNSTTDTDFLPTNVKLVNGTGTQPAPVPPNLSPATVPGVDPQQFFLIGPGPWGTPVPAPYVDPFLDPNCPQALTPAIRTVNPVASYTPTTWVATTTDTTERTTGLTVMLRRLANPYLPLQPTPSLPYYNPYVTVDYLQNIPIQSMSLAPATGGTAFPSRVKRQPYAAYTQVTTNPTTNVQMAGPLTNPLSTGPNPSPVVDPVALGGAAMPGASTFTSNGKSIIHTFGLQNVPLPQSGHYDWLVHLDRQPISPLELMHVSGYQPYQLTQRFIVPPVGSTSDDLVSTNMFQHYVPWLDLPPTAAGPSSVPILPPTPTMSCPWWFDATLLPWQTHRLHRLFEFLECGDRAFGVNTQGRIPGKVNINNIWDAEILQALIDPPSVPTGGIGLPPTLSPPTSQPNVAPTDPVVLIFQNLLQSRSPNGVPGAVGITGAKDRPFLPLSIGLNPAGTAQFPTNATTFTNIGTSVTTDTILRVNPNANNLLLFQNPGYTYNGAAVPADTSLTHPYLQTQLLNKLYNNVTTRSNVFAVWLTVGFFEVTNDTVSPPTLGAEIGRSEGRQVRHRMFAIIDRTNLSVFSTIFNGVPQATGANQPVNVTQATGPQTVSVQFAATSGVNPFTNLPWTIAAGSTLVFDPGTENEETVVLQAGAQAGQLQATFYKSHAIGALVIQRGNPGPWGSALLNTRYDPRLDPLVVPYYSIID